MDNANSYLDSWDCWNSNYCLWSKIKSAKVSPISLSLILIRAIQALIYVAMGWVGVTLYDKVLEIS